jgi:hypothetical protein
MPIIYIDDARDQMARFQVFSALILQDDSWHQAFGAIKQFRSDLRKSYGIPVTEEIHAWKFVSGRGQPSARIITKYERSLIFHDILRLVSQLPKIRVLTACGPAYK